MRPSCSTPALRLPAVLWALALLAVGCGSGSVPSGPGGRSDRLVDFGRPPPYVNAFEVDPRSGDFLLATNRGFFRIDRDSARVRPIRGEIAAGGERATVGTFLELAVERPGRLIGSGHPDQAGALPDYLGFISSDDGGRSWDVVSRLGEADLHAFIVKHGRIYAIDAVHGTVLVSRDGARTFREKLTPRGPITDFEVDPADPARIVASTGAELLRSDDSGASWRSIGRGQEIRLAWPAPAMLYRALKDGAVQLSGDAGATWRAAGRVDGEPYELKAVSARELFLALSDGTILHTTDAARTWSDAFRP